MPQNQMPQIPVIMQIIPELGPGGAEQGCLDVAAELVRSGSKAIVVSHGGSRVHELNRIGALHIDLPVHSKNPLTIWSNIKRLRKLIIQHNVDIVHVRSRAPAWSAIKACKKTNARYMTTCHAPYNINSKAKRLYNSVIARGERVIAISNHVANYLLDNYDIDQRNIRLIHRGVALDKFHPTIVRPAQMIKISSEWRLPEGANIILLPGRLTRWKGHHVLIDAVAKIKNKDVFCVLLGSDQGRTGYREELEQAIKEKNLGGQIRIVDHCNDMPAVYMLSAVVVSASTDPEGFGRIPIEAQAMGRPIIATNHGGAMETVIKNETGWLIEPNDSSALANAIEEALRLNDNQRAILATRAMAHIANNFTRERMVDETLNVYAELLQEKYNVPSFNSQQAQHAQTYAAK
ncbi:MAG: glycosyltransferase family 4 protein [Alphaproteobacteria bacterium]|nr:glycosyltransferase family 4 protein [Alphaproteobacteria bacterium]NCQ88513.1 glycosyltransferase family 4 protein [Alphaproteobacteria bacterium]NCT06056.1 glycosyltransferase family 4 protein [Alphaproteobacteria bacterium]